MNLRHPVTQWYCSDRKLLGKFDKPVCLSVTIWHHVCSTPVNESTQYPLYSGKSHQRDIQIRKRDSRSAATTLRQLMIALCYRMSLK